MIGAAQPLPAARRDGFLQEVAGTLRRFAEIEDATRRAVSDADDVIVIHRFSDLPMPASLIDRASRRHRRRALFGGALGWRARPMKPSELLGENLFAMLSASSTNDVRISALGNRSYALINCSAPSDAKKSRDLLAEAMSALVSRAKKNVGGTSRASAIRVSWPVEIRFVPFSYFCTCWNVTPMRSAR